MEMTPFDIAISSKEIIMIKALLPYFDPNKRRLLSLYIKTEELMNTLNFDFTKFKVDTNEGMFEVLQKYLSDEENEKISGLTNMMEMFEMFKAMNDLNNMEE